MKKGYIQSTGTAADFQSMIVEMKNRAVRAENITMNEPFDQFAESLKDGDCLVLYNLSMFATLTELLQNIAKLTQRRITVESISEPWFTVSHKQTEFLNGITNIGRKLRSDSTKQGQTKAKANGKKLGRPVGTTKIDAKVQAVVKLRKNSSISVSKACALKGCNPRTYYRYMEKLHV